MSKAHIKKETHDRVKAEMQKQIDDLNQIVRWKDREIHDVEILKDKIGDELNRMDKLRNQAYETHNQARGRLLDILHQIRQIPLDVDKEFLVRAIGVIEGQVTELAGATSMLHEEPRDGKAMMMMGVDYGRPHDHRRDAMAYWMSAAAKQGRK